MKSLRIPSFRSQLIKLVLYAIYAISIFFSLLTSTAFAQTTTAAEGHCGVQSSKLRFEEVPITEASSKIGLYAEIVLVQIEELGDDVEIDTSGLRDWLEENIPDVWGSGSAQEWIAGKIEEFADKLELAIRETVDEIVAAFSDKLAEALELYNPRAKLWSTNVWDESCCDGGSWERPKGKLLGADEISIEIDIAAKIRASISVGAGVEAGANAPIELGGSALLKFLVKDLNPVTPENIQRGAFIVLEATPNCRVTVGAGIKGGALIIVGVKASVSGNLELEPVTATLLCNDLVEE